ncbi:MAG: ketoacyl-ACP synthase III [Nanoarchaeota archaeon]|nr:ketoacyl-ACP synthase III [Nanoarchaeota archaeon]
MEDVHLEVTGTGAYLPEKVVKNEDFEGRLFYAYDGFGNRIGDGEEITSEKIYELSGIRERHYAARGETPSSMGTLAAIKAIDDSGTDPKDLVGIILATVSEKINFPSGACKIQRALGNYYGIELSCEAEDIAVACAGAVKGMINANSRVLRRKGNYLVVGAEDVSGMTEDDDRNKFLFGAGAGAVVLTPITGNKGIIREYSISNPYEGRDSWIIRDENNYLRMSEGRKVMKEAIKGMLFSVKKLKEDVGWDCADVYIPHQANGRILDKVEMGVARDGSIVYRNIDRTGNMSSATCLVALDDARKEGVVKKGSKVIMTSFGSGLVTSAVAIQF